MPFRLRAWIVGLGAVPIFLLLGLLIFAPPDGLERFDLAQFVGRFHPLAVHIPIALLLLVPILELAAFFHQRAELEYAAGFVLTIATVAAIASALLGWLLAWSGGYQGSLVTRHMWGGISLAGASLVCWALNSGNRRGYALALFATVALVIWTSDQGGKLTHGDTYLIERMPGALGRWFGRKPQAGVDPTSFYAMRVQPIFEAKCVLCHNAENFKGSLRLDSYANLMRGGKDGPVIQPGDTSKSELFRRVTLPPGSKDAMPAEGKPPLTAAETRIIEVWIAAGATPRIPETAIQGLPPSAAPSAVAPPLTADYRPQLKTMTELESSLGVRLVPRSQNPTDGLILRTASAPERCSDATLEQLAPVANLIVDAELARTKVSDKGMKTIASLFQPEISGPFPHRRHFGGSERSRKARQAGVSQSDRDESVAQRDRGTASQAESEAGLFF